MPIRFSLPASLSLLALIGSILIGCSSPTRPEPTLIDYTNGPIDDAVQLHATRQFEQGRIAMKAGDPYTALKHFEKAQQLLPDDRIILAELARARFEYNKITGPRHLVDQHVQRLSIKREAALNEYESWMNKARQALAKEDYASANQYCQLARMTLERTRNLWPEVSAR